MNLTNFKENENYSKSNFAFSREKVDRFCYCGDDKLEYISCVLFVVAVGGGSSLSAENKRTRNMK